MSNNCCTTNTATIEIDLALEETEQGCCDTMGGTALEDSIESCTNCHTHSRPISRKTLLLMLKPEFLDRGMMGTYRFCSTPDCPVVYFDEESGHAFTSGDLRVRVGLKETAGPIPLCYCFGFDESHIREEIEQMGKTTIPERISEFIREGLCACEFRNPAGICCLGEVYKVTKRFEDR